ncbi:zinc metalloprotease HtpX [Motilibacter deserti]|uniref:Protease HtpX homolog n=1 Tax=Motilibacter deserti TaxID=2714956 RepID=A0ABX0GNL8_9ACTN|nr:zinc metalloprotease HtpX [Motilibacter deserti]
MRSRYAPDRGLVGRMVFTIVLLGLLYVVVMAVLIGLGLPWPLVLVLGGVGLFVQWWFSDRLALASMRAVEVSPAEAPELHAVIDRLCALADMPKPRVAIADTDIPNAFATGRSPKRAVVCATTGILRRLDERELEGVLSHELSHVAHRDVTVMTVASFVSVVAGLLMRSFLYGGIAPRRDNRDNAAAVVLLVVVASVAVYAVSFLLIRALSRYRELAADRAGALLTGQPSALASALVKVSGEMARIPTRDLRQAEAYNAFFFAPALAGGFSISSLFSTHPSLDVRLDRLARISGELGRAG